MGYDKDRLNEILDSEAIHVVFLTTRMVEKHPDAFRYLAIKFLTDEHGRYLEHLDFLEAHKSRIKFDERFYGYRTKEKVIDDLKASGLIYLDAKDLSYIVRDCDTLKEVRYFLHEATLEEKGIEPLSEEEIDEMVERVMKKTEPFETSRRLFCQDGVNLILKSKSFGEYEISSLN
jgi:hypothetical protein